MKRFFKFSILLCCVFILSCGGAGEISKPKIKTTESYDATKEQLWSAIIVMLGDWNFPIKTIEKASWLIQSDRVTIDSDDIYNYCAVEGGEYKSGRLSFTFYLTGEDSSKTNMKITADFDGTFKSGIGEYTTTDVTALYSNGKYEKEIFEAVKRRIK